MKVPLLVILFALSSSPTQAQKLSIEELFERERPRLTVRHVTMGEDATSGFDYLIYKRGSSVRKVRSIWNGGCCQPPSIEDFYFRDGGPVLYVKLTGEKRQLRILTRGRKAPLRTDEKLYFNKSRLTMWIESGKPVPSSDPRWKQKEQSVLEQAKSMLEEY